MPSPQRAPCTPRRTLANGAAAIFQRRMRRLISRPHADRNAMEAEDGGAAMLRSPIVLNAFCLRQFEPGCSGTQLHATGVSPADFIARVNAWIAARPEGARLVPGYAPFCKHVFVPNFTSATPGYIRVADDGGSSGSGRSDSQPAAAGLRRLIKTGYISRRPEELPVLTRWIAREDLPPNFLRPAKFLDLILYSAEQCRKEEESLTGGRAAASQDGSDWELISVKAQDCDAELPMAPITILRNTLIEEGGSGVALDRSAYLKSVAFWEDHVELR